MTSLGLQAGLGASTSV